MTLIQEWVTRWEDRYHARFVVNGGKDGANLKRLERQLGRDELVARMDRYLASDDLWYREQRHDLGVFVSHINRIAMARQLNDVADERRFVRELRALRPKGCDRAYFDGAVMSINGTQVTLTSWAATWLLPYQADLERAVRELVPGAKLEIREA